ncbi:MAG: elongation factor P [Blastocatellia bacterium]|nr:elongation factor P [Blastocatellia bacterium]
MRANQIRRGMIVMFEGEPYRVIDCRHHTPGNLRAMMQTKLKGIRTGTTFEHRFSATEDVERATLEQHDMQYLYSEGDMHHFMNNETYEQIALTDEMMGDAIYYLIPDLNIQVEFFDGNPLGISLPPSVELRVVETEPELKGATVSGSSKPAKMETGLMVNVPGFITEGELIRVDTTEGKYIERVK